MNNFTTHACEQVLRFTKIDKWEDLSEELKVQLSFNMGAMALGLNLTKEDGFQALANLRKGTVTMQEFREHIKSVVTSNGVRIDEANIDRPF